MFAGVSEDEVEHYREVFADTGSHVQVHRQMYIHTFFYDSSSIINNNYFKYLLCLRVLV